MNTAGAQRWKGPLRRQRAVGRQVGQPAEDSKGLLTMRFRAAEPGQLAGIGRGSPLPSGATGSSKEAAHSGRWISPCRQVQNQG